jgi:hypothetical protein
MIFPTYATITLFSVLIKELNFFEKTASLISLLFWNCGMLFIAKKWFYRFEILKNGKK